MSQILPNVAKEPSVPASGPSLPSGLTNTGNGDTRSIFARYASVVGEDGNRYLSPEDFVSAIAPPEEDYAKISRASYAVLFPVADTSKRGLVSLKEWEAFDSVLDRPDAEYQIAWRVFAGGHPSIDFADFVKQYNSYKSKDSLPFDWQGPWASLYLGASAHRHTLSYTQFTQMLSGLAGERARQAFKYYDSDKSGFITPSQFEDMIRRIARHKLSDRLLDSLPSVINRPASSSAYVSYATVRAFLNLISRVELVQLVARNAASSDGTFSRADFMDEAARTAKFATFTPLEVDLLFHFASRKGSSEMATLDGFNRMFDPQWESPSMRYRRSVSAKAVAAKNAHTDPRSFLAEVFESMYNFALGSVAGAFGATVVYPIDLVKTRMQNQRKSTVPGQQLYSNSIDCFRKVVRHEGLKGLYSGLGPQLVGVAPEKAIKLTVNDLVRGIFTDSNGNVPLQAEILAGGSAGACQVVFTNPLEIVKIRLQVQGELARASAEAADTMKAPSKQSAIHIVRQLGLLGLYKGASACLLRDVPFSAIYFPTYAHLKKDYFGEGPRKRLATWELLVAGAVAGIPAAYLTTPFDVIKTRLQVEARQGDTKYTGLRHAAVTIWHEEGPRAFFKGGPARILRSSPQFGCTLAAYEVFKRLIPFPGGLDHSEAGHKVPTANSKPPEPPVKYLRSRNSLKVLLDIDENFGKPFALTKK